MLPGTAAACTPRITHARSELMHDEHIEYDGEPVGSQLGLDSTGDGNDDWLRLKAPADDHDDDDDTVAPDTNDDDGWGPDPSAPDARQPAGACERLTAGGRLCTLPVRHSGPCDPDGARRPRYTP